MLRDDDGWWYRASKDSEITIERTRNPYATTYEVLRTDDPNEWPYVGTLTDIFGNGRYSMHYLEGPELFRYNDEDVKVVNGRTTCHSAYVRPVRGVQGLPVVPRRLTRLA